MDIRTDYRKPLIAFRTPEAPKLITKPLYKSVSAFTEIQGGPNHGLTAAIPYDDAYLVQLRLINCHRCNYFMDGKYLEGVDRRAGIIQIHDLQCNPTVELMDSFHILHFYLPRRILQGVSNELGIASINNLLINSGSCFEDSVIQSLLLSMRPALNRPMEASTVFIDHVAQALSVHVAQVYGGAHSSRRVPRGGLAPWQERRAMELLESDLSGDISLIELAAECRVSVRHFSRAFRNSFGMPAHRYLLKRRVELARRLLLDINLSLHDVALACGFADQSHFTRVFGLFTGNSPGGWRRSQLSLPNVSLSS
ncbi:AraC family transcriptional regulator [Undibacterium sp.]|uniref:AraC family transcriptional regulator n=1 Tax=Undibacterium sp. TaxID=1914977 RepID=UPI002C7724F5|nr:AraC family transcriptional regulator [Undibacterium sp.]HTD05725.1 AraC family transcriptional regulator [Undibacterium sp.]